MGRLPPVPTRHHLQRSQTLGRRLTTLGAATVAIVSVTYLGLSVALSARTTASLTTSAAHAAETGAYRQAVCLSKALRGAVPKGAAVYIEGKDHTVLTQQVAIDLASWAPLSRRSGAAKWSVSVTTDASGASTKTSPACGGLYIHVSRER